MFASSTLILRSTAERCVSKDEARNVTDQSKSSRASWFETAFGLLTMRD
jgi:hypothetical protein